MKRIISAGLICGLLAGLTGCGGTQGGSLFFRVILAVLGLCCLALAVIRTWQFIQLKQRMKKRGSRRKPPKGPDALTYVLYIAALVTLLMALLIPGGTGNDPAVTTEPSTEASTAPSTESTAPSTEPLVPPPVSFTPGKTTASDPANWGIKWEIFQNGTLVSDYHRENPISFGDPEDYFTLPGISAFRGNNYRNSATYGTANVTEETLSMSWTSEIGTLPGSAWSGCGWTGQPLIVKWDDVTRNNMNLFDSKKAKSDLVEVIYATLDGHIYFFDLFEGDYTREPINVGLCFKGAGSLDPRGYPLMYAGAGDVNSAGEKPRMYIISLIDGSILYEYGHNDSLSLREDNSNWCAFDSSPLVDAETDTLIWPGENGLLYTIDLNSHYDAAAGTVTINPDTPVLTRYDTARSSKENYWYGYEASANIVDHYLYVSENGGMFYCVDLNTMELIWAQDTKDDSNSTPVFEYISETEAYVYTAPSLHWTKDENNQGTISIYKLDALTGEIVWEKPYDVHTVSGTSGGVQSSPLLGKEGTALEGLIIYTIARIPEKGSGILVALDTQTGEEVWRLDMEYYSWSSPAAVYEDDGNAYMIVCDTGGDAHLVSADGKLLSTLDLGGLAEASPAVYGDMLVVGTKYELICGIKVN